MILVFIFGAYGVHAQVKQATLPDATIKSIIENRLAKHGLLKGNTIEVMVQNGSVTLSGTVGCLSNKKQAEEAVKGIDDVTTVLNNLVIKKVNRTDQQIANEVAKKIRNYVFHDIFDWVTGRVDQSVVTLMGYVEEPWRKEDIGRLVEQIKGVEKIVNNLEVLPNSPMDDQLRVASARLLFHNPMFHKYANRTQPPIHIIVRNGHILLMGYVQNNVEKTMAERILRNGVSAFSITNNLVSESELKKVPQ